MLNIIVCEDNIIDRNRIVNFIKHSINKNSFDDCNIVFSTDSVIEVIDYAKNHIDDNNVYFLNIDFNTNINIFEAARSIRQDDINCNFVFITDALEIPAITFKYKLKVLDFITKKDSCNMESKINECVEAIYLEYQKRKQISYKEAQILTIKTKNRQYNISSNDILYFETTSYHKVIVHTVFKSIEYYGMLKDILSTLDTEIFKRIHKSYIININQIKEIDKRNMQVIMNNNHFCNLSRTISKDLIKNYG